MNESKRAKILVVGCGVSGLTCGIRLLEAGFEVEIRARERTPHTTSDVAPAFFSPFLASPEDRVLGWSRVAFAAFTALAADPATGVRLTEVIELFDHKAADPPWKDMMAGFRRARAEERPAGYADGYAVTAPIIEMPIYMPFLERCFIQLGGTIHEGSVSRLADLADERLVVNCTGLGAREVANDREVFAIRGQVVRIRNPGIAKGVLDESGPHGLAYIIPRRNDIILGGTLGANDWRLEVDPETEQDIIRRCALLEPRVRQAEVIGRAVGLRPGRREVRLEAEYISERFTVIHNYGHGGAGVSLSWGCAAEVVDLARTEAARVRRA